VTTPIEVSENTIKIFAERRWLGERDRRFDCQASIDSAVWGYVISSNGDRISITNPGGVPSTFQLARQDVADDATLPVSVYGIWLLPVHQEHGNTVQIKLIFYESASPGRGNLRQISTCSKANDSVLSQVDSTFKINKDKSLS